MTTGSDDIVGRRDVAGSTLGLAEVARMVGFASAAYLCDCSAANAAWACASCVARKDGAP